MACVDLGVELNNSTTDDQRTDPQPEKKPRKRLKKLCSQIRDQMEFYFSDANLHKDGYVKKLIDKGKNRYVPVMVFSNFNKLHELTADMKLVVKALSSSTKLEVSEDQQYVRRKTPYTQPKDVDGRTIYVESLPKDVDQEWLQQTFAQYGKVVYVSLPRYRTSGDVKGFAFIEFDTKEGMEKACLSFQPLDPEDKISRFPKYNKQLQSLHKQISSSGEREERKPRKRPNKSELSSGSEEQDGMSSAKRQKGASELSDTESSGREKDPAKETELDKSRGRKRAAEREEVTEGKQSANSSKPPGLKGQGDNPPSKKQKLKEENNSEVKSKPKVADTGVGADADADAAAKRSKPEETTSEGRSSQLEPEERRGVMIDTQKRKRLSDVSESDVSGETREVKRVRISELVDVKENVEVAHKKRRNKKKKKKEGKGTERTAGEEGQPTIKVIPKHKWLVLRKEYLELQRSSMKALKKSLKNINKQKGAGRDVAPLNSYLSAEVTPASDGGGDGKPVAPGGLQFTPGVIIRIDSNQPCTRKELREVLSLVATVPYVDFQDGDQRGFVRCATPTDALRVVASRPATFGVSLLQGEEEADYWRKIGVDREQKRSCKTRTKKRGSQKLMDRAEKTIVSGASQKHIVFDD